MVKKDKVFKQIKNKVINYLKVFCRPRGSDAIELDNMSNYSGSNQILKKREDSIQKRRKLNIGTGQEKLEK